MRIRYLTVVGVFLFIAMFVGLEMRQAADARLIEQTDAQQLGVGRVLRDATDLLALTQNLQSDEGARRGRAWYALHAELSAALAGIGADEPVEMGGAWQELKVTTQRLRPLFEALEAAGTANGDGVARESERAALSVQLMAATQRIHALGWDAMTRLIERRGLQLQQAHQFAQAVNAAMGVLMLLMMGTVFWRVLRPLRQLQDAVEALERGELDARSGVRSNDELGQLSQSLDSVAQAVQERTTSLAKAHRDLNSLLDALQAQQLIELRDGGYWVNPGNQMRLLLLAESIQETLQRYAIVLTRVLAQPRIEAEQLEADGLMMAERLGTLHGINAPEFFDQKLFSTLIHTLRKEGYLSPECKPDLGRFQALTDNIVPLLSNKIRRTIQAGNQLQA